LEVQVRLWEEQLNGRQQAGTHSHDTPNDGGDGERPHDAIIVAKGLNDGSSFSSWFS
jgi:hypothetical protein